MANLEEVQIAYKKMLQEATQQFEKTVSAATITMQNMIKEVTAQQNAIQRKPEPIAEPRDGGLWMNQEAVEMLLQALDKVSSIVDDLQKGSGQQ